MDKHRVIIDTDLGIDDAHAVLLALKADDIQIEGFTTVYGNSEVENCTRNLLYILEMVGQDDIPVFQGSASPLFRKLWNPEVSKKVHGREGLGKITGIKPQNKPKDGNAIYWLVKTILDNPGEIDVLALGPLTNVALAILIEPKWAEYVKRVIFMGGIISGPGNVLPLSTANIYNDAEAAKIVFHGNYRSKIVMVGQDVTKEAKLTEQHRKRLRAAGKRDTEILDEITDFYENFYVGRDSTLKGAGVPIHDLLVPAYLLWPDLFKTETHYVTVETEGEVTRGQTVADKRPYSEEIPQMIVCTGANYELLFENYLNCIT